MRKGDYVRVVKMRSAPGGIPACPLPNYAPGVWGGLLSLHISYWLEGYLLEDLGKGGVIRLDRRVRHGVAALGRFSSTRICSIRGDEVETINSIYRITLVAPTLSASGVWRN